MLGGYKNLLKKLQNYLERKVFEKIIFDQIENKEFEKVFVIVLYDKDKEQEIINDISFWKKKF